MFISRRVNDPEWIIQPNKMKRTTGLYGHTPKFWSCKTYDFSPNLQLWGAENSEAANKRAEEQRERHSHCRIKWHKSATGFLRYHGKVRIITLWYMGNPFRHKLIETRKHRGLGRLT